MLTTLKFTMLNRYLLISLFFASPIHAAEEKKSEESLAAEVAGMAEPKTSKPDREKEISKLIEKSFRGGEALWLKNDDNTFLALYKENTWKETQGAILLLHDLGASTDWPQLINPLRLGFPKKGWHTLSLQLPFVTLAEDKKVYLGRFDEAIARVNAGIEFLKQKNISNIVIIGHGTGSAIGVFYLNQNPQASVSALVTISIPGEKSLQLPVKTESTKKMTDPNTDPDAKKKTEEKAPPEDPASKPPAAEETILDRNLFAGIEQIKIPFLDIYAQIDYQDVTREALKRLELMQKTDNKAYSQWKIKGADHYFRGVEDRLIKRLRGWLKNHAKDKETSSPPTS